MNPNHSNRRVHSSEFKLQVLGECKQMRELHSLRAELHAHIAWLQARRPASPAKAFVSIPKKRKTP